MDQNRLARAVLSAAMLAIALLLMLCSVGPPLHVASAQEEHEATIDMILYGGVVAESSVVVEARPGDRIRLYVHAEFSPIAGNIPALAVWVAEGDPFRRLPLVGYSSWFDPPQEPICNTVHQGFCYTRFVLAPAQGDPITLSAPDAYFLFAVPDDPPTGYSGHAIVELRDHAPGETDPDNYSLLSRCFLDVEVVQGSGAIVEPTDTPTPVTPTPTRKPPTAVIVESTDTPTPVTPTPTRKPPAAAITNTSAPPKSTSTSQPVPITEAELVTATPGEPPEPAIPWWVWILVPIVIGGGLWGLRALLGDRRGGPTTSPPDAPEGPRRGRKPKRRLPPVIRFTSPRPGEVLPPSKFPLVVTYGPGSSPLNLSSLQVTGRHALGMIANPRQAHCDWDVTQPLLHGEATFTARIADQAGEWAQDQITFSVDALAPDLCLHLTWIGAKAPPERKKVQWRKLVDGRILEGPDPAPTFPVSQLLLAFWVKERPGPEKAAGLDRASIKLMADWTVDGVEPGQNLLDRLAPLDARRPGSGPARLVHLTEDNERVVKGHLILDETLMAGSHCFSLFAADRFGNAAQIDLMFAVGAQYLTLVNQHGETLEAIRAIGMQNSRMSKDKLGEYLYSIQFEDPARDPLIDTQTANLECKDSKGRTIGNPRAVVLERIGRSDSFRSEFLVAYTNDDSTTLDQEPPQWAVPVDPDTKIVVTLVRDGRAQAQVECPVTIPVLRIRRMRAIVREIRDGQEFITRSTLSVRFATERAPLPRRIALRVDYTEMGVQDVRPIGDNPQEGVISFRLDKPAQFDREHDHRFTLSAEFHPQELGAARPIAVQARSCDLRDVKVELGNCASELHAVHQCLPFNPFAGLPPGKAPARITLDDQGLAVRPGRFYCVVDLTPFGNRVAVRMSGHVGGKGFLPPYRGEFPDREDRAKFTIVGQSEPRRLRFAWLAEEANPATLPSKAVLDMAVGSKMVQLGYKEDDPYRIDDDLARAEEMQDAWYVLSVHTAIPVEPKIDDVQYISGQARREGSTSVAQLVREKLTIPLDDDVPLAERHRRYSQEAPSVVVVESGAYVDVTLQAMARTARGVKCPAAEGVPLDCSLDAQGCTAGYTFVEAGIKLATESHRVRTDGDGRIHVSLWIPHIQCAEERAHLKIGRILDLPFVVKRRVIGVFQFVDEEGQELDPVFLNDRASALRHDFYLQFRLIGEPKLSEMDKRFTGSGEASRELSSITTYLAARGEVGDAIRDDAIKEVKLRPASGRSQGIFRSVGLFATDLGAEPKDRQRLGPPSSFEIRANSTESLVAPVRELTLDTPTSSCVVKGDDLSRSYKTALAELAPVKVEVESLRVSVQLEDNQFESAGFALQGRFRVEAPQVVEGKHLQVLSLRLELCGVGKGGGQATQSFVVRPPDGSIEKLQPGAETGRATSTYLVESHSPYTDLVHFKEPESLSLDLTRPLSARVTVTYRYGYSPSTYKAVTEKKMAMIGATEVVAPESPFNPLLPDERGVAQPFDVKLRAGDECECLTITFRDGQASPATRVQSPGKSVAVRYDPLTHTIVTAGETQEPTWLGNVRTVTIDVDPTPHTTPPFALVVRHRKRVKVEPSLHAVVEEVDVDQDCIDTLANGTTQTVTERFAWKWADSGQGDAGWVRTLAWRTGLHNKIGPPGDASFFQPSPTTGGVVDGMRNTIIRAKPGATVTMKMGLRTRRGKALVSLAQNLPIEVWVGWRDVTLDKEFHRADGLDTECARATVRTRREGDGSFIKLRCRFAGSFPFSSDVAIVSDLSANLKPAVLQMPYVTIDHVIGPAVVDVMGKGAHFAVGIKDHDKIAKAPEHQKESVLDHIEWYVHSHYYPTGILYSDKARRKRLGADTSMVIPVEDRFVDKGEYSTGKVSTGMHDPLLYVTVKSANIKTVYAIARTEQDASRCPGTVWHVTGLRLHTLGWPILVDVTGGWGSWDATCLGGGQLGIEGGCYIFRVGSGAGLELPFFGTTFGGFIQGADCLDDLAGWYYGSYTELAFLGQGVKTIRAWGKSSTGKTVSLVLVDRAAAWYAKTVASLEAGGDSIATTVLKEAWEGAEGPGTVTASLRNLKVRDLASVKLSTIFVYISPAKLKKRA